MPFELGKKPNTKSKSPPLAEHRATDKAALKGLDYSAQSELLMPKGGMPPLPQQPDPKVPVGGMPKLPQPDPKVPKGGMPHLPQQPDPKVPVGGLPKLPDKPDPKVPAAGMPKLPLNPAEKQKAEDERKAAEEKRAAEEKEKNKARALRKYYVPDLDDPAAVQYCAVDKQASPDDLKTYTAYAIGMVNVLKFKTVYQRYKHMSDEQIANVILYTTNAAYPMNAILRGQLKSAKWMGAYGAAVKDVVKSLKKMPKGVKNEQGKNADDTPNLLDKDKGEDKIVPIGSVYRNDLWSSFFDPVFVNDFKVGRALEEPGFFSATVVQGSYQPNAPVRRTIEGAKVSRSLEDISAVNTEREALFAPGQRFSITNIELEDTKRGVRTAVSDPQALMPQKDGGKHAFNRPGLVWHVKLKHTGVAKGKKADKGKEKEADKGKQKAKGDDEAKAPGLLEKMLGLG